MAGISDAYEVNILKKIFNNTDFTTVASVYISFHDADPGETGTNEIVGTTRQGPTVFDTAAAGATANTNAIIHTSMPACTVSHIGCWDASTSGNFLWGGNLGTPRTLNSGDTFQINAGDLDVTLD